MLQQRFEINLIKTLPKFLFSWISLVDYVIHNQLVYKKATQKGFYATICRVISSYLRDRTQFVSPSDDISPLGQISQIVPQGYVLGLLLVTLYINDLPNQIRIAKCHLYADDRVWIVTGLNEPLTWSFYRSTNHGLSLNSST